MIENVEAHIRARAKSNWSRSAVEKELQEHGISCMSFREMIKLMPDIKWPALGQSLQCQDHYASQRGYFPPKRQAALAKAREASSAKRSIMVTMCGVTLPFRAMCDLWAEYMTVSYSQARRRMLDGWDLYDIFFAPSKRFKATAGGRWVDPHKERKK